MPTVFRLGGVRFFFYSNERDPRESLHVHMEPGGASAKIRVLPTAAIAESIAFDRRELSELRRIVDDNRDLIERARHEHFG